VGQGVRDGQWYGRPKQQGGLTLTLMMCVFFIIAIVGGLGISLIFSDTFLSFIGVILGLIWFLVWIIGFFVMIAR
jgi:hypothetical protein